MDDTVEVTTLEWDDAAQLRYAAEQGRCLATRKRDDFTAETLAAYDAHTPHAGLLILTRSVPNDQFTAVAAARRASAAQFPDGLQSYTIDLLSPADSE